MIPKFLAKLVRFGEQRPDKAKTNRTMEENRVAQMNARETEQMIKANRREEGFLPRKEASSEKEKIEQVA